MEKKARANLIFVTAVSVLALLGVAAVIYFVDPFFHYHGPIKGFDYVIDNQVLQNPGMALHMDYDSVILGSSMTVNFETDWFKELHGLNTLKLSSSSAYPKDIANILDKVYSDKRTDQEPVKKVFLGVDVITYSGGVSETKYPVPEYLYDDKLLNDYHYLLNKDVLLNYVLRPIFDPEPLNMSHIYASWWTEEYYNEEYVLSNHVPSDPVSEKMDEHSFDDRIKDNLQANIIPFVKAHPETEFVVFFPPYSILFWNDVILENHLDATMNSYRTVVNELINYDNVSIYFFPSEEFVTDLNNYADYSHYKPDINRFMTECFKDGTDRVYRTSDEGPVIDDYLAEMTDIINNYDFVKINQRIKEYHE